MTGEDLCGYVEVHLYEADGVTRKEPTVGGAKVMLTEAHSFRFSDELAADGSLSFQVPTTAAALVADPDLLEDGIVKLAMVLTAGAAPTEVLGFELVPTSGTVWTDSPSERQITASCPGLRHLFTYGVLFPEVTPGWDDTTGDERLFGWMSSDTFAFFDAADWDTPLFFAYTTNPLWIALGNASKITADLTPASLDVNLFRSKFYLASTQRVRIYWHGDGATSVFLDSELLGTSSPGDTNQSIDVKLNAGWHTIAGEVLNADGGTMLVFACIVATLVAGVATTVLLRSDTTHWKVHKVVGAKPGWTPGNLLIQVLTEAQAQGVYGMGWLTWDFTDLLDSDGNPWTQMPEKGYLIGQTTLADVVRELEELEVDVRITPAGVVQAFISQGADVSSTVALVPGGNLATLDYQGSAVKATTALVRSIPGWSTATDATGAAAYGDRWMGISAGNAVSYAQANKIALRALEETASPRYTYTATLFARAGCVPFSSFGVGDTLSGPTRALAATDLRLLSISGSTPADTPGPVMFTVEMDTP